MSDSSAFGLKLLHPLTTSDIAASVAAEYQEGEEEQEGEVVINGAPFVGHFRLESHENFDEFLKAIGVGLAKRMLSRAACVSTIDCWIDRRQQWTVITRMMGRAGVGVDNRVTFKMHSPNDHVTMDGRKATSLTWLEGERKMIHQENWTDSYGKKQQVVYEHHITSDQSPDDTWTCMMSMGKVKCMRRFKRQIVKNTTGTPSAS